MGTANTNTNTADPKRGGHLLRRQDGERAGGGVRHEPVRYHALARGRGRTIIDGQVGLDCYCNMGWDRTSRFQTGCLIRSQACGSERGCRRTCGIRRLLQNTSVGLEKNGTALMQEDRHGYRRVMRRGPCIQLSLRIHFSVAMNRACFSFISPLPSAENAFATRKRVRPERRRQDST